MDNTFYQNNLTSNEFREKHLQDSKYLMYRFHEW